MRRNVARWTNHAADDRVFPAPPAAVRASALRAIPRLGWKLNRGGAPDSPAPADPPIEAVWISPVFRFRDDVCIEIAPAPGGSLVRVRSASRVGRYDFGQNAKHIRELFSAMAKELSAPDAKPAR